MNRRRLTRPAGTALLASVLLAIGCRGEQANLTELQKLRSGPLDVVLLSPDGAPRHGKDQLVIEFRSATDGSLIDVGSVRGSATMPMGNTPMLGTVTLAPGDAAGRYSAECELSMAGTWRMPIEWDGPMGKGSVTFATSVQ